MNYITVKIKNGSYHMDCNVLIDTADDNYAAEYYVLHVYITFIYVFGYSFRHTLTYLYIYSLIYSSYIFTPLLNPVFHFVRRSSSCQNVVPDPPV